MHNVHLIVDGLLIGTVLAQAITIIRLRKTCGTLLIDKKSDKDVYRFEIDDLDSLTNKKFISLNVNANADLSHQ